MEYHQDVRALKVRSCDLGASRTMLASTIQLSWHWPSAKLCPSCLADDLQAFMAEVGRKETLQILSDTTQHQTSGRTATSLSVWP